MIAVIDYGLGNLRSVSKALEQAGAEVEVTGDPRRIEAASALVLPGVGAFARGMKNLSSAGLIGPIRESVSKGKPILGICLGLQLFFTDSEEYGNTCGLDIIKGKVMRFKLNKKTPHMGWNTISLKNKSSLLFKNIPENSSFYFVHSYYVSPVTDKECSAITDYGISFCSAVEKDNIYGVQFHPEKSGPVGLRIMGNFIARSRKC